ncbi:protein anoxia up-regulated-like isoform X8 [Calliopsis andreniformis]|uniref:protein anoxia up-regulated-like isoform X8 n=1 Tax=Calliopsis andreniformis TaxID=337506 RepID=UPI003FCE1549
MVYESDFYTTRRPYSRPLVSSYSVTTPRHYVVRDYPEAGVRTAQEHYSYAYTNTSSSSSSSTDPYSRRPQRSSHTEESVVKRESGPYGSYSTERSSRTSTGGGPGGYHSSYESHTSGRLPGGTSYRHFSYRV